MSGLIWRRRLLLSVLTLTVVFGVIACTPADVQEAQGWANDWAKENGYDPNTFAGWINIASAVAVGTGDPQVDAALSVATVLHDQATDDKLANDGLANGDMTKVNQAISDRPKDFTYVNDRALVEMANGNLGSAQKDFAAADALAATQGPGAPALNLRNRLMGLQQIEQRDAASSTGVKKYYDAWFNQRCADQKKLSQIPGNNISIDPQCPP